MNAETKDRAVYESLIRDVVSIHFQTSDEIKVATSERRLDSCWRIGERIVEVEQQGGIRASYGKSLIEKLADELASRDVRGLSARSLWQMRRFFLEYDRASIRSELSWSHYQVLLAESDLGRRAELEELAIRDRLPVSGLNLLIRTERATKSLGGSALERPAGTLWRYEVEDKAALGQTAPGLLLNLGFRVRRLVRGVRVRGLEPGDAVQARFAGRAVEVEKLSKHDGRLRYVYAARVERVVDGDTIVANVDLGFGVSMEMRLRLRGVDAADAGTAEGEKARQFVARRLRRRDQIAIRTYKHDPYDRYVADIFYVAKKETNPARIFESGRFLNEELLQKGMAVEYRS